MSKIVQYIIVSGEITRVLKIPICSLIAQCCQVTSSVLETYRDDFESRKYLRDIDTTERLVVEVRDETELLLLRGNLQRDKIKHHFGLDESNKTLTCIALKPYRPADIPHYVKQLKLFQ